MQAMNEVLQTPPSASDSNRVSLESRYGMCRSLHARALITRPSVSNDLLMNLASRAEIPSAPEREISSEPAKSINVNVDSVSSVPDAIERNSIVYHRHGMGMNNMSVTVHRA